MTKLFALAAALASALAGALAAQQPAPGGAQPIAKKALDLGPNTGAWRAFDSPNGAFYVIDGDGVRILRTSGEEIARIPNANGVTLDASRSRLAFLRSSDPAGTPVNWSHQFAWTARIDPATGRLLGEPRRASIHPCIYVDLSADGKSLLCARNESGGWSIYTLPSEGGEEHLVVKRPVRTFEPLWSRDGKWIYYSLEGAGQPPQMERVASAGGKPEPFIAATGGRPIGESLDGKYFAIGTNKGPLVRIYTVAGRPVKSLLMPGHYPSWSSRAPHDLVSGANDAPGTLKSVSFPDGRIRELPKIAEWQGSPRFTPDGTQLIYRATVQGRSQLVLANHDGEGAHVIATRGEPSQYDLSPNGRWISFVTPLLDSVYVMDLRSESTRALMPFSNFAGAMSWRPDSRAIRFVRLKTPSHREIHDIDLGGRDSLVRDIGDFGVGTPLQVVDDTTIASLDRTGMHLLSLRSGAKRTIVGGRVSTGCLGCRLSVSPDGRWIGFELDDSTTGAGSAYIVSREGKTKRAIGEALPCGRSVLGWHPNGQDVFLYGFTQCDTTETENLYAGSLTGGPTRNLTASEPAGFVNASEAALQPNGTHIVYEVGGVNRASIHTLDLSHTLP